jgi:predicted CXXCH cytochrome family protein
MKKFRVVIVIALGFIISGILTSQSYAAEENQCLTCHTKFKEKAKSVHAAMGMGCEVCHKAVPGKTHPDQKGSIVLIQEIPGLCYSCHDQSKFKRKSVHQPVSSGMCTGCHDPHQSNFPKILVKDIPGLCYTCHQESKFKGTSGHTVLGMCTGCHDPHSSDLDKILKLKQPELCYSCHDKSQFTKKYVHSIITVGGCTSCHTPHASNNPSLLPSPVNDLCLTCHRKQASGGHVIALPGGRFHPIRGFKDPSTLKFIEVPDPKNPKRKILQPDPKVPGKDMTCVSCHNPHSSDYRNLFTAERLCLKCHKNF